MTEQATIQVGTEFVSYPARPGRTEPIYVATAPQKEA